MELSEPRDPELGRPPIETANDKNHNNESDNKEEEAKPAPAPLAKMFTFATRFDWLLISLGTVASIGQGIAMPLMTIVFGQIIDIFTDFARGLDSRQTFDSKITMAVVWFCIIGIGSFVLSYISIAMFMWASERQTKRIREQYYLAVLKQEVAFFDQHTAGTLATRITSDAQLIQAGIGENLGQMIMFITLFISGLVLAFVRGWKLALVLLAVLPLLMIAGGFMSFMLANLTKRGQQSYAKAGSVVEEVLGAIRTVAAYGGEKFELERYSAILDETNSQAYQKALYNGAGLGVIMFLVFGTYGLGFWYGAQLVSNGEMTGGTVLNVFFALIIGSTSVGNAAPNIAAFSSARGAMSSVLDVVQRRSLIDPDSEEGRKLDKVNGKVEFRDASFFYPNRPDVQVLKGFSLTVNPGQTVALVGSSGSGKSTIVQLVERFYDPSSGSVFFDGVNVKDLNVRWYRQQVGLVGQEPVLFSGTIRENILNGHPGATQEEVERAAKEANAHNFITKLPKQYDTPVGEGGALLSGGQKQRIAIARALCKGAKVLLLDEATAALDSGSERVVQQALDRAAKSHTTVVVAHRLATIKNADLIVVMDKGSIVETGTHQELMDKKGAYFYLVQAQNLQSNPASGDAGAPGSDKDEVGDKSAGDEAKGEMVKIDEDENIIIASEKVNNTAAKTKATKEAEEPGAKIPFSQVPLLRIAKLNQPELPFIVLGSICSAIDGCVMPLFSLAFGEILAVFARPTTEAMLEGANFWASMFAVLAGVGRLILFLAVSGQRLTTRVRKICFKSILSQDIAFFDDDEKNGVGVLSTKLASEAEFLNGLFGQMLNTMIKSAATIICGFTIAFSRGWELTLIVMALLPFIAIAGYLQMKMLTKNTRHLESYAKGGQLITESVQAIRTVASLTAERAFAKRYQDTIAVAHKTNLKTLHASGFSAGISNSLMFFGYAAAFWFGSRFVLDGKYTFNDMNVVMFAVVFTSVSLGQVSTFAPNIAKAKQAAVNIFELIDSKPTVDPFSETGKKPTSIEGRVTLKNVKFAYPRRPEVNVMTDTSIEIQPGQTIALVGESGCGKSTMMWLLERFYDTQGGQVMVDGIDVKDLNVGWLRRQIGLVTQEPKLFAHSIKDNIRYGRIGKNEEGIPLLDAKDEEVQEVAKAANIHDFIEGLTDKYDTMAGEKGAQLSGGQKQRVAIARALLRKCKILLLDEATSALDTQSERLVQDALDKARVGRTTIMIAHRLSTVKNADRILVLSPCSDGSNSGVKIVEDGTHDELVAKRGLYYSYVQKQEVGEAQKEQQ